MEEKIIIGLIGEAGSGKDTVADYVKEKYGATVFRYSDPLREALEVFLDHKKVGRADFVWMSNNIRAKYGNQIISEALVKRMAKVENDIVIFNGLRIAEDVEFLKTVSGSKILYVTVDQKSRWQRLSGRGEKADDVISFEGFQELERAETEVQIPEIGKKADFRLENTGTKEDLYAKTDEAMKSVLKV
jgi:dephospho-CoA kinase